MENKKKRSRWDQGPKEMIMKVEEIENENVKKKRNRWDVKEKVIPTSLQQSNTIVQEKVKVEEIGNISLDPLKEKEWTEEMLNEILPSEGFEIYTPSNDIKKEKPLKDAEEEEEAIADHYQIPLEEMERKRVELAYKAELEAKEVDPFLALKKEDQTFFQPLFVPDSESVNDVLEKEVLSQLYKIKHGTLVEKKAAVRSLITAIPTLGLSLIITNYIALLMLPTSTFMERHYLLGHLNKLLASVAHENLTVFVKPLLGMALPMLMDGDIAVRKEGREFLLFFARLVRFKVKINV